MSYQHDIFVSYAGEDKLFARQLVEWLEQVDRLDVWFAEEDMAAGEEIQEKLAGDVAQTRHFIFIISDHWLRKDWTRWECDLVLDSLSPSQRLVPILRIPRNVGKLGPRLHRLKSIDWREDEADPDARFWETLCGLGLFELGKQGDWAEKGRQARGLSSSNLLATGPEEAEARAVQQAGRRGSRHALTCDRDPQWGDLSRLAADERHEAILVAGPQGEAHRFFLERIVSCLPRDPARRICEVWWGARRPLARGTALDAIAEAVGCPPGRLEASLRAILCQQNLVLVHRPPFEDADCDTLIRYYTEWLPELIAAIDRPTAPEWRLKVVQAIRWPEVGAIKCGLLHAAGLFGVQPRRLRSQCAKAEAARELMKELENAPGALPIRFLDPLAPITLEDVHKWSRSLDLDEASRTKLVDDALDGTGSSADILNRIAERLDPQRRSADDLRT